MHPPVVSVPSLPPSLLPPPTCVVTALKTSQFQTWSALLLVIVLLLLSKQDCAKSLVSKAVTVSRVHVSRWSGGWWIDGFAGLEAKARREGKGGAGGRQQKRGEEEEEARKEGRRRESRIDSGKLGAVWLRRHVSCSRSFQGRTLLAKQHGGRDVA